ncbi:MULTISPECIES: hypothetical protein [Streptomyces]|uniref:Uncharacterized protein n=1 Tax=Streptomyces celluloflavus TaxID=58344 RepID=A0ABW7R435_9ACTN|nr:hypothetical protein [Streptomyces kasugaensis]WSK14615.1 hypothetical protein OG717_24395 [Streptomyces celluloflavus]
MDAEEARRVDATLRRLGLSWVVAPVDPNDTAGDWSVFDIADPVTREPVKADALASVLAKVAQGPLPSAGSSARRGFVIPSKG